MYADPQTLTIATVSTPLARVGNDQTSGTFSSADGVNGLRVSHTVTKSRKNDSVKLEVSKIVADPFVPAQNVPVAFSVSFSVNTPYQGVTKAEAKALGDSLAAWLTASSGANITKLVAGES